VKLKTIIVTLFLVSFVLGVNFAHAGTVRGLIVKKTPQGRENPVQDIPVTLCRTGGECSSPMYTDTKGMYYFYNVPAGNYILKIWANGYNVGEPVTREISVSNQQYTDVKKIVISSEP